MYCMSPKLLQHLLPLHRQHRLLQQVKGRSPQQLLMLHKRLRLASSKPSLTQTLPIGESVVLLYVDTATSVCPYITQQCTP